MVDGPTETVDLELTENNRAFVRAFVQSVLIEGQLERIADFIDEQSPVEHNPHLEDSVSVLRSALEAEEGDARHINYHETHRVLAEGSFVLSVSEGAYGGKQSAFYDLFRIESGKVVEHWDTTENIAPRSEWNNENEKF